MSASAKRQDPLDVIVGLSLSDLNFADPGAEGAAGGHGAPCYTERAAHVRRRDRLVPRALDYAATPAIIPPASPDDR
jgi:hypothetical protein